MLIKDFHQINSSFDYGLGVLVNNVTNVRYFNTKITHREYKKNEYHFDESYYQGFDKTTHEMRLESGHISLAEFAEHLHNEEENENSNYNYEW